MCNGYFKYFTVKKEFRPFGNLFWKKPFIKCSFDPLNLSLSWPLVDLLTLKQENTTHTRKLSHTLSFFLSVLLSYVLGSFLITLLHAHNDI